MSESSSKSGGGKADFRTFRARLLRDLDALEKMHEEGLVEETPHRIGAEQELFLVDRSWRPAPKALEVLERLKDERFTTELALYNLEFNLDPVSFGGRCLSRLERQLDSLLKRVEKAARAEGCRLVLVGILPTLGKADLGLHNMTPRSRYRKLDEEIRKMRGGTGQVRIKGRDELILENDTVMLESCNTSFQLHFQIAPRDFVRFYNAAQLVSAPLLAAAGNSPLLLGRRLWRETRITLFQQAVDTRRPLPHLRYTLPRVNFGRGWLTSSALEIFRENVARFPVLLDSPEEEDPFESLSRGAAPRLRALQLHNSTIYRWNRPCYGVYRGRPHLRIENRVLPSGPTVLDETANAAFFFGLLTATAEAYPDLPDRIDFGEARENFLAAARHGLGAQFTWPEEGRDRVPAGPLILDRLLPAARQGLLSHDLDPTDVDRLLGVLQERVRSEKTGSQWLLDSLKAMEEGHPRAERMAALTAALYARRSRGLPVHQWEPARPEELFEGPPLKLRVEEVMTVDPPTVRPDEPVELAARLMQWEGLRHLPVEDQHNRLLGLVVLDALPSPPSNPGRTSGPGLPVHGFMDPSPVTVTPETNVEDALAILSAKGVVCLPVVADGRLVGVVTEAELLKLADGNGGSKEEDPKRGA